MTFEPTSDTPADPPTDRYHGFSLRSVMWGYRPLFEKTIEELFAAGSLGPTKREVTERFFDVLKKSDQGHFDHVLQQFLGALHPHNRWIMDLPGVFTDLADLGMQLAENRSHHGVMFFKLLGEGAFGNTPRDVRNCIGWIRRLREIDADLAMAFLAGHATLRERMEPLEIERYIDVALQLHGTHPENARKFLRGELASCEAYIQSITQECRLCDVAPRLQAMIHALAGVECAVDDLGRLDSDELIERGTVALTLADHLYLPQRVRRFPRAVENHHWYALAALASASMLLENTFARIHGREGFETCVDLVGTSRERVGLFLLVEHLRTLRGIDRRWPGARRLLAWGLDLDRSDRPACDLADLLARAMASQDDAPGLIALRRLAEESINCFDTAGLLDGETAREALAALPEIATLSPEPVSFLSDFLFPVHYEDPPADSLVAGLKQAARQKRSGGERDADARSADESADGRRPDGTARTCPRSRLRSSTTSGTSARTSTCRTGAMSARRRSSPAAGHPWATGWRTPARCRLFSSAFGRISPAAKNASPTATRSTPTCWSTISSTAFASRARRRGSTRSPASASATWPS